MYLASKEIWHPHYMYIHVYPKILCTPLGYSITKKIWYPYHSHYMYQGLVHVDSKGGVMSAAWILFVYAELYVHVHSGFYLAQKFRLGGGEKHGRSWSNWQPWRPKEVGAGGGCDPSAQSAGS